MFKKKKKEKEQLYDWRSQWTAKKAFAFALLCFFMIIFIFPFYWIITGSFKDLGAAISIPPQWVPQTPTTENWTTLFNQPVVRWTLNSFFIAISTTFLVCITSSLAGYVLAKKTFPGKKIIFWSLIIAMALPKQVIMVPLFNILTSLDWIDSYKSLILPAVGWPFGIFLMKQFSETIPGELLEAARIDGCSELGIFRKIVLPIVKPGVAALAIFTFITSWNDYFMQLILIRSTDMQTLPLGVATMQLEFTTNYGLMMAGAALASIPMIIIFLIFQKSFTQGITIGAVKG